MNLEQQLLENPSVSYWLKNAIRDTYRRDCVDALHDAEVLVEILRKRVGEAL